MSFCVGSLNPLNPSSSEKTREGKVRKGKVKLLTKETVDLSGGLLGH